LAHPLTIENIKLSRKNMKSYNNFIGIDIGKFNFVVAIHGKKPVSEYGNTAEGIDQFLSDFRNELPGALCILEPTGGYEMRLLLALCDKGFAVHRAHTRKVKNFIRSFGSEAKTDSLDARNLGLYGYERSGSLDLFKPQTAEAMKLYELIHRRRDLTQMLVAEKNRMKSPRTGFVQNSIETLIDILSKEIKGISGEIENLIKKDMSLNEKKKMLKTIPGIGDIIANELLALLPELGQISRREIASLVGLAPISRDSGKLRGYRRTGHGRGGIKRLLFLAAMAARNSKSHLKAYYESLVGRGKCKMVALTALMRKIIVIANARLKNMTAT
jgi:transposase